MHESSINIFFPIFTFVSTFNQQQTILRFEYHTHPHNDTDFKSKTQTTFINFHLMIFFNKKISNHITYIKQKNSTTRISKTFSKSTNLMLLEISTNSNPSYANSNPSDAKRTSIHSSTCKPIPTTPFPPESFLQL